MRHVVRMMSWPSWVKPSPSGRGRLIDELPANPLLLVRQPGTFAIHHVKTPLAIPTPVAGASWIGQVTPGLWRHPLAALPDHIKLAIFLDLADVHRFPGVMVLFVHLVLAYRARNFQPLERLQHFVHLC